VILISARAGEEARVDGVEAGADDYLTKPFNARELVARVSTHLELARVRRDAAEQIRTTLESVTDGLHVVDRQARFTYLNATARRMMAEHGVDPAGLIGREFFEAFPATRDLEVGRALTRSLRERVPTGTEGFYEPWQRWFNVRHYPTSEGGVSTFFQDVTERRRAEAILRQNEALFSALVELAPMGVYVVDAQFRLQQINARALPAFEKVQPAVGRDFSEVMEILWGPVVSEPIIKIFRHTLATGEHYVSPRFSNVRQDLGEERTYHWETQRMTLPDGQHGVVCYFNDITESTRAEQALLEAKASAERANRSKDLFLAALSHELRTPLTPVLVTVSALREDERLPAEVREQLAMTERNIALEARLIDDLLDLSAIANGKLRLQLQGCDAHPLIRQALEMTQDTALTKEISVACELNASHSGLMMDPVRFQQVVWNLIRNAVKFTPRGGRISIRTTESSPGGGETWFRLEVTDSGIGIEPGSLERIFQPFEQALTAGQHRFGGLGLGLAIVRAIVDLHGGKVFARSDGLNQGATFIAEFRGAVVPSAENGIGSAPHSLAPQPAALNGSGALSGKVRRILLVEDHASTLQALSTLLRRSGYEIAEATTVAEALAQAAAHAFDLVISDLGLPDGTGIQLMDQLRKHHGLRGIALTGYGMEEDVARARAAGFVAHLIKPVQINELRTVLTTLG
jgi:PAS domain S-box-containing protein